MQERPLQGGKSNSLLQKSISCRGLVFLIVSSEDYLEQSNAQDITKKIHAKYVGHKNNTKKPQHPI
jgi:hypothetical protein